MISFGPSATGNSFCSELIESLERLSLGYSVAVTEVAAAISELALAATPPVLPLLVRGESILAGPLYLPGDAVCPICYEKSVARNLFDRDSPIRTPVPERIAEVCRQMQEWWNQLSEGEGDQRLLSYAAEIRGFARVNWHPIFPWRNCPRCGKLGLNEDLSLRVHCSPMTGIVTALEITSAPAAGAFRARSTWSSPLPVSGSRPLLRRQTSYGRGRAKLEAENGCIGEALERYSLIYQGNEALVQGRLSDLDALHPNDIMLYSEAQYAGREAWNLRADEEFWVGDPFDESRVVDWILAQPLGSARNPKFVAAACCLMWFPIKPGTPQFAKADTIGCGGGITLENAQRQALLEWVERDAIAIWWDNMVRRPAVRPTAFGCAGLEEVARGLRAIDRDLFLLDCTTDIGIPVYVSVAPRFDGSEVLFAAAADPSPRVAAIRAATEVGQPWYEAVRTGASSSPFSKWLMEETLESQAFLKPTEFLDAPIEPNVIDPAPVEYIVERLQGAGLQAYSVDHSRPEVSTRVARAIVPGLRHVWNRRAPGRLYDVPVKLGWLRSPRLETELNPIRCMI